MLMASSEARVDLPFVLFRLAYLFPLFPPSANTRHDTHEDLAMRLARPGEIVVDTEEIFLEELLCDPVPDRIVVACRNIASCYSASASWSPADEIASDIHDSSDRDAGSVASPCSEHQTLYDDTVEFDSVS